MHNHSLIKELKKCETSETIEAVFKKYKKTDPVEKIDYIRTAWGNRIEFSLPKAATPEDLKSNYVTLCIAFITHLFRQQLLRR